MTAPSQRLRIVIAGGGVAGVELALALDHLAAELVDMTIVSPDPSFQCTALQTAQPFLADHVRRHALCDLADHLGAALVIDSVSAVDADRHAALLSNGKVVHYDCLVLATGGRHRKAFSRALTFTGDESTLPFNDLLADLEEHWTHSVAFVVPPGVTWPLPLYELAIMTSKAVRGMAIDDLRIQLVSPEPTPLAVFGQAASAAVGGLLREASIDFRGETYARATPSGVLELLPRGERLEAERVVSLPTIGGPELAGVPADDAGFILIDDRGRVPGLADVFAAGDGTTFPIKQGGIACQLADVIAEQLAARAGASVEPQAFRPILRGRLLTGHGAQYLEHAISGGADADPPSELQLWSASRKVHGQYLSPWLDAMDQVPSPPPRRSPRFARGQSDERAQDSVGMDLDPSSPMSRR